MEWIYRKLRWMPRTTGGGLNARRTSAGRSGTGGTMTPWWRWNSSPTESPTYPSLMVRPSIRKIHQLFLRTCNLKSFNYHVIWVRERCLQYLIYYEHRGRSKFVCSIFSDRAVQKYMLSYSSYESSITWDKDFFSIEVCTMYMYVTSLI